MVASQAIEVAEKSHPLDQLLADYRAQATDWREMGTYFERLVRAYLENDPLEQEQFEEIWPYPEWARENNFDPHDTGIDLVAKLRDEDGYCAIQCKFHQPDKRIQKDDIDKFLAASGKEPIKRRIFVDSTDMPWGENAENTIIGQSIPVYRRSLAHLKNSRIDWSLFRSKNKIELSPKKGLRQHQREALQAFKDGFVQHDRGKLIMACGTGKTFTSLKIAEDQVGEGGTVLYMVPSLALMSQMIRDWSNDSDIPLHAFAVCSDAQVGKRRQFTDDVAEVQETDLQIPATTDAQKLASETSGTDPDRMKVIFATYQSIDVIKQAQNEGLQSFDMIIADEAHRTTGAKLGGEDDSNFVKIHYDEHVSGAKRLYMTATPRIFGEGARKKADEGSVELCSMDDEELYGPTLFTMNFSRAVDDRLLTDYKVIVLAMDEASVSANVKERLEADNELKLDDATKIVGCYKALAKEGLQEDDLRHDPQPMRRGLAFCKDISTSKLIRDEFPRVTEEYRQSKLDNDEDITSLKCSLDHIDGGHGAKERQRKLDWLGDEPGENECRILSNAKCLSEGVDVPALDAILFLHPRKSKIDVVQSVGRVMRKAENKKLGYIILPVAIPGDQSPEQALNDNERYRVVWEVLNALRSHDERLAGAINNPNFESAGSGPIEVVPVTDQLPEKAKQKSADVGECGGKEQECQPSKRDEEQLSFIWNDLPEKVRARIAQRCGQRGYWEDWAKDIADIAQRHIERINTALEDPQAREKFDEFLSEIRDDLNDSVSEEEAIEMLAQHLITQPVFDALFEETRFTQDNPVSQAMQSVMDVLEPKRIDKEAQDLKSFYDSVRYRAQNVESAEDKQHLINELYEKFFSSAFPKTTERLGIVYTPNEVVDFIIHSVNDVLRDEFGQDLGSEDVHILDPFTGTGTFITRLLQSGLIPPEQLSYKFKNEIHANEIILLAYYIAAVNIETAYQSVTGDEHTAFPGICLTDTFQLFEEKDMIAQLMPDNSERRQRQQGLDIRVIMGNPPYSSGQRSANDNAANISYPSTDRRISETYAAQTQATNKNALYDSYIRSMRWASDRLGEDGGVIGFVTNAGWIEGNAADGLRKCLAEEFSNIYIFHLRGHARTSGEQRRKEKDNVFGEGTRAPVAITLFVKNPNATNHGNIYYHDIGDYLSRNEKLAIIRNFQSVDGISASNNWTKIEPDEEGDWVNKGDKTFQEFIKIGDKKDKTSDRIFDNYSSGVKTQRDPWCYNSSRDKLKSNIETTISYFNQIVERVQNGENVNDIVSTIDQSRISWSAALQQDCEKGKLVSIEDGVFARSLYRPFTKQWLFYSRGLNERVYQVPKLFPDEGVDNRAICVTGVGARDFSVLMADTVPCLDFMEKSQCFPLKLYEGADNGDDSLFENDQAVRDAITDNGLAHFQEQYPSETITKEDLFYYIYGILHSTDYRARFQNNLSKELPRIPAVKSADDFWAFCDAGRKLGDLHVNFEDVEPYPVTIKEGDLRLSNFSDEDYRVEKMRFAGKRNNKDKTTVIYNNNITMTDIPLDAYNYVVNGKPALEWVMERQQVTTDKKSGIVNDPNDYAIETMGDPAYPLKLFQRVITVSLETLKIVRGLPELDISEPR